MTLRIHTISVFLLAATAMLCAQPRPGPPPGRWWNNPDMARKLGLTADQQKKMDDIFQQARVRLIDLHAALDKEEAMLEPLMQAAQPDDAKVLPEIDKIAQARAELEKANARLLLAMRHVLTPEQWQILQRDERQPRPRHDGPGGPPPPPNGPDRPRR